MASLDLVNAIEAMLEPAPGRDNPELMEYVASPPTVRDVQAGSRLGAALPGARRQRPRRWRSARPARTLRDEEDQRIVARPRYRDLISALRFVARQELIFGIDVHVGVDNLTRPSMPPTGYAPSAVLARLSANSPFWRAARRAWRRRARHLRAVSAVRESAPLRRLGRLRAPASSSSIRAGVIEDLHVSRGMTCAAPEVRTVEIRVMDLQTHIEHSLGLAALVQAMVNELAEHFDAGKRLAPYPFEMLDENKWLAARHGLEEAD